LLETAGRDFEIFAAFVRKDTEAAREPRIAGVRQA
jgi:hypothetical protein